MPVRSTGSTLKAVVHHNPSRQAIAAALDRAARAHGIPPDDLEAVAAAESSWRQFDRSGQVLRGKVCPADQGIMQINQTAHPEAFPKAREDYLDNIAVGASILRQQYDRYHDWTAAIAAYNAGSVRFAKGSPRRLVNQAYVDRVLALARQFAAQGPA
ncbi:MAG: lytic transglycosylase domain-containing protein [Cyanobacteria bacterium REEB65]|nr:lytic transglycosylase domain-containing protein [Cyanobacteria bacterium REEB65]